MDMDVDIVPMGEFALDDRRARHGIVGQQILDRLVGEDHAPAERVVGPVALEQVDVMRGIAQLHRDREIEARRARRRGTRFSSLLNTRARDRPRETQRTQWACASANAQARRGPGEAGAFREGRNHGKAWLGHCTPLCL